MKRLQRALTNFRRQTNIETQNGFLGDGTGETHDRSETGNFWVRFPAAAGGLTAPVSLPLMTNANLKPDDGVMVEVGMWKNRPVILGMRLDSLSAAGINPIQLNPADPTNEYLGPIRQYQIITFKAIPHGDVTNKPFYAAVWPGVFYVSGVPYFFVGGDIDLSSFVPTAGEHLYASVFMKTDRTLEAFASTAIPDSDPLSDVDLQEADALKTADSYPVWSWELRGDDTALSVDPARQVDLRQAFGSGGGASALGDLTDVSLASVAQGDILVRKATDWNNVNVPVEGVVARITGGDVAPIAMAASTILARLASGSIVAATVAQIKTLLAIVVADISDLFTYTREKLTAARTYYVRTDGNDTNTGLVNSAGGAFLTVQKAVDVASALDNGGFDITVQVVDGTYSTSNITLKTFLGSGSIIIQGNSGTPANVVLTIASGVTFTCSAVKGLYKLRDMKLTGTGTAAVAISVTNQSTVEVQNINFGAGFSAYHLYCATQGNLVVTGNYEISGGTANHAYTQIQSYLNLGGGLTITMTGTPNFTNAFAKAQLGGLIYALTNTYSGATTGKRYLVDTLGIIFTNGGGANFFPGNVAGTPTAPGIYI